MKVTPTNSPPTIGILAGMGPRSTAPFIELVLNECQRQYGARDDIDFPKMVICSQPAPFYEDRPTDHAALEAAIREGLKSLERSGADFLAIACNTAHIYYEQLSRSVAVPLLDMVGLTVADLPETTRKVALVAARPTVESGIYQSRIRERGSEVVQIDWQSQIDHFLSATRDATEPAMFVSLWRDLSELAQAAGADTLVVACLDLSAVIGHAQSPFLIVDAAQCLARRIVSLWRDRHTSERLFPEARAPLEVRRDGFIITTDPRRFDLAAIHAYLTRSYWAEGISAQTVERSVQKSLCFGLFDADQRQVGFARVVTDRATFAYLCDVYVLEEVRGKGLGKWLIETVKGHDAVTHVRRFVLATKDAHSLYAQFDFTPLKAPERFMEIVRPDIYKTLNLPARERQLDGSTR